jgi:CRISPR-associated endonuclease/helicase Cas3
LLFRGYGHSSLTASIFTGLAANDSLILLDEAHCSVPFMQTLQNISTFRGAAWAERPIVTPFAFAILSATPPADIPHDAVFPGADRERALNHTVLSKRLCAQMPAVLVSIKGKTSPRDADLLVGKAVEQVLSYRDSGKRRIAVIVNRVNTARQIEDTLRKEAGDDADVVLLTGRIRLYERDRLVERWQRYLRAGSPEEWAKPIILVSTQCIEVGADFSFDALVAEAASLDALRQRFGRLNRMGDAGEAPAAILVRERDLQETEPDPIYGGAIRACWKLPNSKATGEDEAKSIDFGFDALDEALADVDGLAASLASPPDAPILLPAHLDLLCQTAPAPAVEPDIGLYLHGKERGAPEARVVWRADLSPDKTDLWKETVALCPPASGEMLTVPLYQLRTWLAARQQASDDGTSDVEGASAPSGDEENLEQRGRPFLLWRGRDHSQVSHHPQEIKPDDIVVVPAGYPMADLGQSGLLKGFGADGLDLWELARKAGGKPPALRITRASLERWTRCPPVKALIELAMGEERDRDALQQALAALRDYRPAPDDESKAAPDWLCDLIDEVRGGRMEEHPARGVIIFARRGRSVPEPDLFVDDDDLSSAVMVDAAEVVSFADHTRSVERATGKLAERCLPDFLEPLLCSARWHDAGKLDERFQHMLRQGADISGEPLAKSATMLASPEQWEAVRAAADLPKGFRHKMLSLQLAERSAGLREGEEDLVLHLIASHHGHARPFAPVVPDDKPTPVLGHHAGLAVALGAAERARLPQPQASVPLTRSWRIPFGDIGTTSPPISSKRSSSARMPTLSISSISATDQRRRIRPSAACVVIVRSGRRSCSFMPRYYYGGCER